MPTLANVGYVSDLGEPKATESGTYVNQPITIEGIGGSRGIRVNLLYRPEWFVEGFNPDELEKIEGGSGMLFVYRKNIAARGSLSVLAGLCGSDEVFAALQGQILDLPEVTAEAVHDVLQAALIDGNAPNFGYTLKQKRTKTGVGEDGKNVSALENQYEVDQFWYATEKNQKAMRKRASRDQNFKVNFDDSIPF
ncbi:MAG: hypothetical protein ABFE02_17350 [Sulfuricella sp.]